MAEKPKAAGVEKSLMRVELNASLGRKILEDTARNLEDRPRLLNIVSRFAQDWEKQVYATKGGVAKRRWKPLAASTGGAPLVRTGALKAALTGAPRKMKASVQVRMPDYGMNLIGGRFSRNSKKGTGERAEWKGLGGSMPRRHPAPRPPKERLAILTADLLGVVTPKGAS